MAGAGLGEPPAEDPAWWLGLDGPDTDRLLLDMMQLCDEGLCEGSNRSIWTASGLGGCDRTHFPHPLCLFRCVIIPVVTTGHAAMLVVPQAQSSLSVSSKRPLCVSGPEEFRDE